MTQPTRTESASRFRTDMEMLLTAVSRLSDEQRQQIVHDDWTVKDVLAHIAAWDRELVRGLDELLAGRRPAFVTYDETAFNDGVVAASRQIAFDQVLAETKEAHEVLIGRIEGLTDEEWAMSTPHRWNEYEPLTIRSMFAYTYKGETHYGGHLRDLEAWVASHG